MTGRMRVLAWCGTIAGTGFTVGLIAVAVLADLNTAGQIAGIAGAVIGLLGVAVSVYALVQDSPRQSATGTEVTASGTRSVAASGSVGTAITGDQAQATPGGSAPAPPSAPQGGLASGGAVQASGERSVAAGRDIGHAATGDSGIGSTTS